MKLIDVAYKAYKEWHKNKVATVEQSLIANGIPYEEKPQGDLISRIYVCPFCAHKIRVTEQLLPKVTECEVFGAEIKGGAE